MMNFLITYMFINWFLLLYFIFLIYNSNYSHPLLLMMNLIIYSIIICLNMSLWKNNYLYSFILFFILISGLFILFLYFSSLISNESISITFNKVFLLFFIINFLIIFILLKNTKLFNSHIYSSHMEMNSLILFNLNQFNNIMNIFNYPFNNLTLLTLIFLLFSMIIIIKMCMKKSSYMRKL